MENQQRDRAISIDGRYITFTVMTHGRGIECSLTRDALEQYFWLQRDADEKRLAKAFEDGRKRIMAVAERKALAVGAARVLVTAADFASRSGISP
jgi:hypothetical protein